jgi:DNA-binding LacI/PurR family transcriptional regulator
LGPEAFQVLLVESDETPEPDQVSYGNYLNEILPRSATARGRIELQKLLESPNPPTGIICYNEVVAMGALLEALEQGLRVPEDLAFVCTNRSIIAELSPLSLTTADYPSVASAECAMDLLMDTLHGRVTEITYRTVDPVLKVGQTSVAQPKSDTPGVAISYCAEELLRIEGDY